MLRSSVSNNSDAYILIKGNITVRNTTCQVEPNNAAKEKVIFKTCVPFINQISRINKMQVDYTNDIDIVMPMCNLIEYSDNYLKTSGALWQFYRNVLAVDNNGAIKVSK